MPFRRAITLMLTAWRVSSDLLAKTERKGFVIGETEPALYHLPLRGRECDGLPRVAERHLTFAQRGAEFAPRAAIEAPAPGYQRQSNTRPRNNLKTWAQAGLICLSRGQVVALWRHWLN